MKPYIFGILAAVTLGCNQSKQQDEQPSEATADSIRTVQFSTAQMQAADIQIGTPDEQMLHEELVLQGQIEVAPENIVSLSFPLSGYLRSAKVLPGSKIQKGQSLAEIEDMQFIQLQQDYLTAQERLTLAESEFERHKSLNTNKASSDKVFQQARTEMQTQHILVNSLAQKLHVIGIDPAKLKAENISRSVRITSPINGYVSKVHVSAGKYTSPTDPLFELIDPGKIHLTLQVFEKDLNQLSVGQKVLAYTNNNPDEVMEAEVVLINKNLDPNRMAEVHCHFKKHNSVLVPGMFMNARVAVTGGKALTVPQEAVVRWENEFYVFEEKKPGTFEMLAVAPGRQADGKQQLAAEGLKTSTPLVLKNAYSVLMKMKNAEGDD